MNMITINNTYSYIILKTETEKVPGFHKETMLLHLFQSNLKLHVSNVVEMHSKGGENKILFIFEIKFYRD